MTHQFLKWERLEKKTIEYEVMIDEREKVDMVILFLLESHRTLLSTFIFITTNLLTYKLIKQKLIEK